MGQHPDGIDPGAATAHEASARAARPLRSFISTEEWTRNDVLRTRAFWVLLVAAFGQSLGYTLYFAVGLVHLQDLGHPKAVGAWALSIFGISTLLGKLALGALGDRYDPRYVWAATAAAFGFGLILMSTATTDAKLFLCIVLLGFGFGGGLASMFAVLSNYFGPKVFPAVAGLAVAITTCAGALAPPLAGVLYGRSGSYRPTFLLLAGACFVGALLMVATRPPRRTEPGHGLAAKSELRGVQ
jgi:MFS family permease